MWDRSVPIYCTVPRPKSLTTNQALGDARHTRTIPLGRSLAPRLACPARHGLLFSSHQPLDIAIRRLRLSRPIKHTQSLSHSYPVASTALVCICFPVSLLLLACTIPLRPPTHGLENLEKTTQKTVGVCCLVPPLCIVYTHTQYNTHSHAEDISLALLLPPPAALYPRCGPPTGRCKVARPPAKKKKKKKKVTGEYVLRAFSACDGRSL